MLLFFCTFIILLSKEALHTLAAFCPLTTFCLFVITVSL